MATIPLDEIRKLSVAERMQLVEEIWDSVAEDGDAESLPVMESQRRELDERLADLDAHPDVGRPWDEVKARLLGGI